MPRRRARRWIALLLTASQVLTGCAPTQPFFLHEDGDLSHYLDVATDIQIPDLETVTLADAQQAHVPLTLTEGELENYWDLPLEEAVAIALQNSKVIRSIGQIRQTGQVGQGVAGPPETLTINSDFTPTIYDVAIQESDPNPNNGGVEAALAAFDAQLSTDLFWDRTDRPQNVTIGVGELIRARLLGSDTMNVETEIQKRSAQGTQWSFRNITNYDASNQPLRVQASEWLTSFEAELRQPLLRASGTQVNRIPVILARIRTDISLADFEANVRNFVYGVEQGYWDLYFFYRNFEATKKVYDATAEFYRDTLSRMEAGAEAAADEAQIREQYYFFQGQLEEAKRDVIRAERQLRYLMGIAPTDGRFIRPSDELTIARVEFDWHEILAEALTRSGEIRRIKWRVKQRELELIAAKNNLLPQFDAVALYRWLGLGDDLLQGDRRGRNFPEFGSLAFDELTEGRFQEWRLGFQFQMPIGFRAELAAVRSAQLQLAREKARLEDMELEITHALSDAWQNLDANYQLARTALQQWNAAQAEVSMFETLEKFGFQPATNLNLLNAQRSLLAAETAFYQSLVQYNRAILEVHYRKGSLLEYNSVLLQEGPWPAKAYWDAMIRARRRDASYYLDYGFTRPRVISRGHMPQHAAEVESEGSPLGQTTPHATEPGPGDDAPLPAGAEPVPLGTPTPADEPPLQEAPPADADSDTLLDSSSGPSSAIRFRDNGARTAKSAGPLLTGPAGSARQRDGETLGRRDGEMERRSGQGKDAKSTRRDQVSAPLPVTKAESGASNASQSPSVPPKATADAFDWGTLGLE